MFLSRFVVDIFKDRISKPITVGVNHTPVSVLPAAVMCHKNTFDGPEVLYLIEYKRDCGVAILIDSTPQFFVSPVKPFVVLIVPFRINSPTTMDRVIFAAKNMPIDILDYLVEAINRASMALQVFDDKKALLALEDAALSVQYPDIRAFKEL